MIDSNGNLIPAKRSTLNAQFDGKRFSRKHINDILLKKMRTGVSSDLITLNFLIFALKVDQESNAQRRYHHFIQSTNQILDEYFMGPLVNGQSLEVLYAHVHSVRIPAGKPIQMSSKKAIRLNRNRILSHYYPCKEDAGKPG